MTAANEQRRYVGRGEVDLAPTGIKQAGQLGERFASLSPAGLYSSNQSRAVQTAAAIGKIHGLEPVQSPLLREINFGRWEGKTYEEIMATDEALMTRWYDDPFVNCPPEGDGLISVAERMQEFTDSLPEEDTAKIPDYIVVTHGGAIRAFLHKCLGWGKDRIWEFKVYNASVSLVEREGGTYKVISINDTEHL